MSAKENVSDLPQFATQGVRPNDLGLIFVLGHADRAASFPGLKFSGSVNSRKRQNKTKLKKKNKIPKNKQKHSNLGVPNLVFVLQMDDREYDETEMHDEEDEDAGRLRNDDAWPVCDAYFAEKGLVNQQLDSYNEFVNNTMQEVVTESPPIELFPEPQVPEDHPDFERKKIKITFGQIYLSQPLLEESDGTTDPMVLFY